MKIELYFAFFILIFNSAGIFAQQENQNYLPLRKKEMSNTFPIKYIGTFGDERPPYFEPMEDVFLPQKINAGVSEISISRNENELMIFGKDKRQKDWSVKLEFWTRNAVRFYITDLDKNGIKDLILLIPTGGNGLSPTSHFMSLTFDQTGRPIPFRADGYFDDRNGKIFDLVDIDKDGRAELLYMNFDDGYWITNFYKIQNARWEKIEGKLGNRFYPLYTRFTNKENRKPTVLKKDRNPFAPDLSNKNVNAEGTLISYEWANKNQSEDITLKIRYRNGKIILASPVSWYSSFFAVIDTKNDRKIVSLFATEQSMKTVLDEIIAKKYSVKIYGNRKGNLIGKSETRKFRPEMMWASEQ